MPMKTKPVKHLIHPFLAFLSGLLCTYGLASGLVLHEADKSMPIFIILIQASRWALACGVLLLVTVLFSLWKRTQTESHTLGSNPYLKSGLAFVCGSLPTLAALIWNHIQK